ncbi:flippase [Methanocaldococcus villosus]|uniref:flippase n=1 Tax=Methanocaldococcus villosus TaxID=667126 RepID=UPI0003604E50|nr:flippase [Methanocaldococcus villosus]
MSLKKDSIFVLLSNIYSKVMAYLFYFITAFLLGVDAFGILRGLMPILDTLTIFFSSGIPPSMAKFISEGKKYNYIQVFFIMLTLSIFGFFIAINVKYILGGYFLTIDNTLFYMIGFCIMTSTIIAFSRGILQGLLKIRYLSLTWIIENTLKIILSIVFILSFGLIGAFISISLSYILTGILAIYIIYRIKKEFLNIEFKDLKFSFEISKYAIPIALTTSSYRLFGDIDNIIILSLLGSYWSGVYGYSALLSRGIYMISSSISIPLLPRIASGKNIDVLKEGLLLNTILASSFVIIFLIFPDKILKLLFNTVEPHSIECLKILALSSLFMSYYSIISSAMQGLGFAKISLYIIIFGVLINIILNYILINSFGIIGGSLATLISSVFMLILGIIAIRRIDYDINNLRNKARDYKTLSYNKRAKK